MKPVPDVIRTCTPDGYALAQVWIYKDAAGDQIGAVARYDLTNGGGRQSIGLGQPRRRSQGGG